MCAGRQSGESVLLDHVILAPNFEIAGLLVWTGQPLDRTVGAKSLHLLLL